MDYQSEYSFYQNLFEDYMHGVFDALSGHKKLIDAMKYSLDAGGKRVRPVLMLATCRHLGGDLNKALPFALALECIHTYSLIHDDLPSMDNDDLRRGKPTNHKVFGEDFAILAGDALLNFAFEHMLKNAICEKDVLAMQVLADCAGYSGMIGGQAHDVCPLASGEEQLLNTVVGKTAKLVIAPLKMSAILFGGNVDAFERFGKALGIIYQFVDDLLDAVGDEKLLGKAVNKDAELGKVNAVSVYGESGVRKQIDLLLGSATEINDKYIKSQFLQTFLLNSTKRLY